MEIYKLSDLLPSEGSKKTLTNNHKRDTIKSETLTSASLSNVITDLKQGVKNPNRVNVYIDGKYAFSLDIAQVVDLGVKKGLQVSAEKLSEFKKASEFGKLYQRALEWCLTRPRSEKEVRDYLYKKLKMSSSDTLLRSRLTSSIRVPRGERYGAQSLFAFPVGRADSSEGIHELLENIVEKLKSKKYLDDQKFAEYYVENRFVKKGISKKRLQMELMKKGINKTIIDEVLNSSERSDAEEIQKIIAKKRARYDDEKLIQYLCRQGFPYQLVKDLVKENQ